MDIDKFLFAIVTLGIGFSVITYLRELPARLAIIALAIGVMFLGPKVFGQDWYYDGFIAGCFMGDFFGTVHAREGSSADHKEA